MLQVLLAPKLLAYLANFECDCEHELVIIIFIVIIIMIWQL